MYNKRRLTVTINIATEMKKIRDEDTSPRIKVRGRTAIATIAPTNKNINILIGRIAIFA
ncbi:hypothetical protein J26TS2_07770 [Shouchella clausii]|nr:hypothetical protein J26TS2_07770 [Shouchella clausii]